MRNVNKRVKRRDNKIHNLKMQVEALEQETDEQSKQIKHFEKETHLLHKNNRLLQSKNEQTRVRSYHVSKKAEKEAKVVEVNLDEIYSQFEELQLDYDSKVKCSKLN